MSFPEISATKRNNKSFTVVFGYDKEQLDSLVTSLAINSDVGGAAYTTSLITKAAKLGDPCFVRSLIFSDIELDKDIWIAYDISKMDIPDIRKFYEVPPDYLVHGIFFEDLSQPEFHFNQNYFDTLIVRHT